MNNCKSCNAELFYDQTPVNRGYRCASCGSINHFGDSGATDSFANQNSKWSLRLGLVLVGLVIVGTVLLFRGFPWITGALGFVAVLLGIAAIYFGLRAFLRSRYENFSERAKWSAILGSASGGCFGISLGTLVSLIFIGGLILNLASGESRDPERVKEVFDWTASIELPDSQQWQPAVYSSYAIFNRVEFWDDKDFLKSQNRFYLMWMNAIFWANKNDLSRQSLEMIFGGDYKFVQKEDSENLNWTILGENRSVNKVHWVGEKTVEEETIKLEYITYQCQFDTKTTSYCLSFLSERPSSTLSEDDIKSAFESFQPAD